MAAAWRVRVREFIDQDKPRTTSQDRVEIHFLESAATVLNPPWRNDFQSGDERRCLLASVGLHHADYDVDALTSPCLGDGEHLVGLTNTGRGTQEDQKLATLGSFRFAQQRVR